MTKGEMDMCDVTLKYYMRNYSEGALLDLIMDSTGDTNKDMLSEIVAAFAIVKGDVRQLDVKRMMQELNLNSQGSVEHFCLAVDAQKRAYKQAHWHGHGWTTSQE